MSHLPRSDRAQRDVRRVAPPSYSSGRFLALSCRTEGFFMQLRLLLALALGCAIATAAHTAHAQGDNANALKQAQDAFDQAQLDYLAGKWDDAAEKFKAAHVLRPFPQFLYNVGAAYHMKGKKTSDPAAYEQAIDFYK